MVWNRNRFILIVYLPGELDLNGTESVLQTDDGIVGSIFGLTEIDREKDQGKVLTPEIDREIDRGKVITPIKDCKKTEIRFLEPT